MVFCLKYEARIRTMACVSIREGEKNSNAEKTFENKESTSKMKNI